MASTVVARFAEFFSVTICDLFQLHDGHICIGDLRFRVSIRPVVRTKVHFSCDVFVAGLRNVFVHAVDYFTDAAAFFDEALSDDCWQKRMGQASFS